MVAGLQAQHTRDMCRWQTVACHTPSGNSSNRSRTAEAQTQGGAESQGSCYRAKRCPNGNSTAGSRSSSRPSSRSSSFGEPGDIRRQYAQRASKDSDSQWHHKPGQHKQYFEGQQCTRHVPSHAALGSSATTTKVCNRTSTASPRWALVTL